jgi:hypothetical protein
MKADESADCEVLSLAWQGIGLRNGKAQDYAIGAFIGLHGQKRI